MPTRRSGRVPTRFRRSHRWPSSGTGSSRGTSWPSTPGCRGPTGGTAVELGLPHGSIMYPVGRQALLRPRRPPSGSPPRVACGSSPSTSRGAVGGCPSAPCSPPRPAIGTVEEDHPFASGAHVVLYRLKPVESVPAAPHRRSVSAAGLPAPRTRSRSNRLSGADAFLVGCDRRRPKILSRRRLMLRTAQQSLSCCRSSPRPASDRQETPTGGRMDLGRLSALAAELRRCSWWDDAAGPRRRRTHQRGAHRRPAGRRHPGRGAVAPRRPPRRRRPAVLRAPARRRPSSAGGSPPHAPAHLSVGIDRLADVRRSTLLVVAPDSAPAGLLQRVCDARRRGATILTLAGDDGAPGAGELTGLAHEAVLLPIRRMRSNSTSPGTSSAPPPRATAASAAASPLGARRSAQRIAS